MLEGLRIPVDDPQGVCFGQALQNLAADMQGAGLVERAAGGDELVEGLALEVLEHHVGEVVGGLAEVEDRHRVGVAKPADDLDLVDEALRDLGIGTHHRRFEAFEGNVAPHDLVARLDDLGEAAGAQLRDNTVLLLEEVPRRQHLPQSRIGIGVGHQKLVGGQASVVSSTIPLGSLALGLRWLQLMILGRSVNHDADHSAKKPRELDGSRGFWS